MIHYIRADIEPKTVRPSTLRMGGSSPSGESIGLTNYYLELNGKPFFGICGEFHYSRYPSADWEQEIRKMKMSGINIAATYIFWNHHEEQEGVFDWKGDRNLRRFVELCGECGLYVILRVGPFCHGEVRNGGLPDWLFGRPFDVRSNDEGYLEYVRRLYEEIGRETSGLMFGEGGPVIGIQLENEFNAAAALWELTAKQGDEYLSGGSGGEEHMLRLKKLASGAGLVTPLYTCTGWGGAPVPEDEVLPLYGGYAYTPWSVTLENPQQQPTREYLFGSFHEDESVIPEFRPPYPRSKYPFACCEMGGGMQTWYLSRFQVEPESVQAMSLVKIAGGCNFVGYYMFHGGTNPVGKTGYLNESTTPRITYDFQAPIGEFGQIRSSNHGVRSLHYFLQTFGGTLAPMATVLPEGAESIGPEETEPLRYAVRTDGRSGFLFVNNYQDHVAMKEHRGTVFEIRLKEETVVFPRRSSLTVRPNASFFLPFRFPLSGLQLRYATAQPVTCIESEGGTAYFFRMIEGTDAEFGLDADGITGIASETGAIFREQDGSYSAVIPKETSGMIRIGRSGGGEVRIYALTPEESSSLWITETEGAKRLFLSDVPLAGTEKGLELYSTGRSGFEFREFVPKGASLPSWRIGSAGGGITARREGDFAVYSVQVAAKEPELGLTRLHDHKVVVSLEKGFMEGVQEVILSVDYTGNVGYAFSGGRLFHDHFYNGAPWEIGLSRFAEALAGGKGQIVLETTPLRQGVTTVDAGAAMAMQQRFEGQATAVIRGVTARPVYHIKLTAAEELNPGADGG